MTPGINLGLVSPAPPPCSSPPAGYRAPLVQQIDDLKLAESTATGKGLAAALGAIEEFNQRIPGGNGGPPDRVGFQNSA
jgi:Ca-activated chloride channel family protein